MIDVDVDLVGNTDVGPVAAKAEIGPKYVQQHKNDDDEDDDCKNSAAATAISRFDHGRMFALHVVAIVLRHGNSPCSTCYVSETNEPPREGFRQGGKSVKFYSYLGPGLIALASCGPRQNAHEQPLANSAAPVIPAPSAPGVATNATSPPEQSENRAGLPEPERAIDPKSVEAAGQLVQHYAALIEQKRFSEAAGLWSDAGAAADFARQLEGRQLHLEIGALGETEGAAGSIYTSVPIVFRGAGFRRSANIILRRVNDVPGSTEAERRWHIERIEWDRPG
jgi:hypothetical protein